MTNKFILKNNYAELIINSTKHGIITAFVDIEDVPILKNYSWFIIDIFKKTIAARINKKNIKLHRFITNCPSDKVVDHINHNRLDNRKCNLRICTQKENMQNLLPNCRHGKYIFKHGKKYCVKVPNNGKNMYLGLFNTIEEAQKVVNSHINYLWDLRAI